MASRYCPVALKGGQRLRCLQKSNIRPMSIHLQRHAKLSRVQVPILWDRNLIQRLLRLADLLPRAACSGATALQIPPDPAQIPGGGE